MSGDTGKAHSPAPEFDDEQHIQPLHEHRVDGEEVAGQDASRLAAQKRPPSRGDPSRRWVDAVGSQHSARFGFRPSQEHAITPPVPGWEPYFQVRPLSAYTTSLHGRFTYPEPFTRS
ncbi:MAG TPA: hypothetical protein VIV12_07330 [Streptosporangiaceae bacterium]